MAIILFNPTDEEMRTQYIGEEVVIPPAPDPRHKIRVDDARGRHVLNVLGPRGLMTLEYGDEGDGEARKAEIGRQRNLEFWRKQVMDFNQLNDQQHQKKLPYIAPSPQIKAAARRLGIKLYEPMSSTDDYTEAQAQTLAELDQKKREVAEKDKVIQSLSAKVDKLTSLVESMLQAAGKQAAAPAAADEDPSDDWAEVKRKIKSINGNHFDKWVRKNWDAILDYPDDVRDLIAERWELLYKTPFPTMPEEVDAA
jgi:hypothetical protein